MNYREALQFLDDHVDMERANGIPEPDLIRITELMALMGDPQRQYRIIHVTGTNGKSSTTAMISRLVAAAGLGVGTFSSPHPNVINERIRRNGEPIPDAELAECLGVLAALEPLMTSGRPSYFELVTAAALRWFADVAIDVAVLEVGMGGRWDATNVADADVAVVTNVELDHMDYLGPTRVHIAREKAGIVKKGTDLVLGETDPEIGDIFRDAATGVVLERDEEFGVVENLPAVGGRLAHIRTPSADYEDVFIPLYGAHQAENAAAAIAATELFFAAPLSEDVVREALAELDVPGRLEVLRRRPLCILDGAHNPAGARSLATAVSDEFRTHAPGILVFGLLRDREAAEMLEALEAEAYRRIILTTPASPRALPAAEALTVAQKLGLAARAIEDPREAVHSAVTEAEDDELVVVAGSLYLAAPARHAVAQFT